MGAWKIVFTDRAIADLKRIVRRIARDNPSAAERVGEDLIERTSVLNTFPELGSAFRGKRTVRKLSSPPYLILYRIHAAKRWIEILTFWHGSRQEPEL